MDQQYKSGKKLQKELQALQLKYDSLKASFEKGLDEKEQEVKLLEKLSKATDDLLRFKNDYQAYNLILEHILQISEADYASFNIFNENSPEFRTVAVAGPTENLKKGLAMLGYEVSNKLWKHDPIRAAKTKHHIITRFDAFHHLCGNVIPAGIAKLIENTFGLGEVYLVKIAKDESILGDFTLIFNKNKKLVNSKLVEVYAHQVGMFLDRNNIINSLRGSQENYRILFENTGTAIITIEEDNTISQVNSEFLRLTGFTSSEIENLKKWNELADPDDKEWMLEKLSIIKGNPGVSEPVYSFRYFTKSGERRHAIAKVRMLPGSRKSIASLIDITDHTLVQQALHDTEVNLQAVFNATDESIFLLSTDNTVIAANDVGAQRMKHSPNEMINRNVDEFLPADVVKSRLPFIKKVLSTGQSVSFEDEHSGRWVKNHVYPVLNSFGEVIRLAVFSRDISDWKLAEDSLAQTRINYEAFFNTIDDLLFVLDENGSIIHTNKTVTDRLGYTREELIGQPVLMVHPPERRAEAAEIVSKMIRGLMENCPVPVMSKQGVQIPVETRITHGFWNGKPAIYGVTKDISKLRFSEEKFSKSFQLNPSACGLTELENNTYIEVNEAFTSLLGYEKHEVVGKTAVELGIFTEQALKAVSSEEDADGKITNLETEIKTRKGDTKYVLLSAENIYVQDKKHCFTVIHDITARKNAEAALTKEKYLVDSIMNNLPDHIYFKDLDSHFIRISKAHARFFNLDNPEMAIGKTDFDFFSNEHAQQAFEDEQEIIRSRKLLRTEEKETFPDKPDTWVSSIKMPLYDLDGNIAGTFGISRDITESKLAGVEIKMKNTELEKLNAEKDKFFSIIAHDLRGPFSGFLELTELMAVKVSDMTQEKIQQIARVMNESAANLYGLLGNLLEWSRMQRGLTQFEPISFRLKLKAKDCLRLIHFTAIKKEIVVNFNIPDNLFVTSDANMLEGIIRNLTINAIKFTPKGGNITISAKSIPEKFIQVSISDSGIGIQAEMLEQLFVLNKNTSRKGTEGEPSTGLGLIICKDFVEKHGGKLWVESIENAGSTFHFTIPGFAEAEVSLDIQHSLKLIAPILPERKIKVLIAEDDKPSEILITEAIKKQCSQIIAVNAGYEAVEACRANPDLDLILMDINMSGIDGYEATRQIR